ncbi:zf-HC2 domain-containing protein [Saccharothrix saharensis]|uniref:zf-HC2 domain-containing protein n=1 Tax=Saccharothrix saharensis TaxID=571190 RepID=UPI003CCC8B75
MQQAYLQAHIADASTERCRAAITRLGAWIRSGLTRRETAQVEDHLDYSLTAARWLPWRLCFPE